METEDTEMEGVEAAAPANGDAELKDGDVSDDGSEDLEADTSGSEDEDEIEEEEGEGAEGGEDEDMEMGEGHDEQKPADGEKNISTEHIMEVTEGVVAH
jgi:histone chaperone ASF1